MLPYSRLQLRLRRGSFSRSPGRSAVGTSGLQSACYRTTHPNFSRRGRKGSRFPLPATHSFTGDVLFELLALLMLAANHRPRITDFQITPLWPVYNRSSAQGFTTALFPTSYQMAFTVKTRENVLEDSFPNLPPQAQKGSLSTALQYSTDQEAII